jgi:NAD(P)-dependent dehydrogenase (short-subunit alcohol dehydrogenase family)
MSDNTAQAPMGTGIGYTTTAEDVLRGVDLTGKRALVTGGYSGIGLETTRSLVAAGASVLVPARRPDLAREELAGLATVEVGELDLADQASVTAYAAALLADGRKLDVVINSAAVKATPLTRVEPGWELQLATNHLGHFALVNRVWPALNAGARVISVSSRGHFYSPCAGTTPSTSTPTTSAGRPTGSRRPPTRCSPFTSTASLASATFTRSRGTRARS